MYEESLLLHAQFKGKLSIQSKVPIRDMKDLSLAYSPGVAEPCRAIRTDRTKLYEYTAKGNLVAVITDGSAVLGLGNIGAHASIPVMEGKAVLFKRFADIDAIPLALNTQDIEQFIQTVKVLEPVFGGINLEDIAAPACFEIEERLKQELDIPVFHDDQHGTAIVTIAALVNALKIVGKSMAQIKVVINGAGAAGYAITGLLNKIGVEQIVVCDTQGIIHQGRTHRMNATKQRIADITKVTSEGTLKTALQDADVFVGVSAAGALTPDMVKVMARDPIVFAMANPDPEIMPDEAKAAGVRIIGTGRSDYPNQINNVLAFPGIFRGALDSRATKITDEMKLAAAYAIAELVSSDKLGEDYIIPDAFDERVVTAVAKAVHAEALTMS